MQKRSINLGKRLIKKLGLERSVDTPSRWMVHELSKQVVIARTSRGKQKMRVQTLCLEIFLILNQYQKTRSHRKHEIDNLSPITDILDKLNK